MRRRYAEYNGINCTAVFSGTVRLVNITTGAVNCERELPPLLEHVLSSRKDPEQDILKRSDVLFQTSFLSVI